MSDRDPDRTAIDRTRQLAASSTPRHQGGSGDAATVAPPLGITVFGCGPDEAALFEEMAPDFGVTPTLTGAPLSVATIGLARGNRCISVGHQNQVPAAILLALHHAGVSYVSTRSVGYNHIDVQSAQSVGLCVENVAYGPDGVADYTVMLMLMAIRNAKSTIRRAEVHDYRLHDGRARELRDLTVGVVGTGRIGAAVMSRLRGFGCPVLAYDRCPDTSADYVPLDELLQRSDLVTLHATLNADTHHLLNRRRIDRMRHGAIIVNTGRGPLLDTEALLSALESGRLGGAALDVLEDEEGIFYSDQSLDTPQSPLLQRLQQLPNVVITPHTAYYTDRALRDTVEHTLINCLRFERRAA